MEGDYYPPTPIDDINADREDGERWLDMFEDAPLAMEDLASLIVDDNIMIDEFEVVHSLVEDEEYGEELLREYNNEINLETELDDTLKHIESILMHTNNDQWIGAFFLSPLDEWTFTFSGPTENKQEIRSVHSIYIRGYKQGRKHEAEDRDNLIQTDNPLLE